MRRFGRLEARRTHRLEACVTPLPRRRHLHDYGLGQARPPGDRQLWLQIVERHWIDDQKTYFSAAQRREVSRLHQHERAIGLCVRMAVVMGAFSFELVLTCTDTRYVVLASGCQEMHLP
jgi:hypothetical protein